MMPRRSLVTQQIKATSESPTGVAFKVLTLAPKCQSQIKLKPPDDSTQDRAAFLARLRSAAGLALKIRRSCAVGKRAFGRARNSVACLAFHALLSTYVFGTCSRHLTASQDILQDTWLLQLEAAIEQPALQSSSA